MTTWRPPPPGPQLPDEPPVCSASMQVDASCPRRIARSATLRGGRSFFLFAIPVVAALLVGLLPRHASWGSLGSAATGTLWALVTFVVILAVMAAVIMGVALPMIEKVYARMLPVGSTLAVDYYPDRMVVTSAGDVVRQTMFHALSGVRVTRHCVVFGNGPGGAALPLEVVPPEAVELIRRGAGLTPVVPPSSPD